MALLKKLLNSKLSERIRRKTALITGMHLKLKRLTPSASEEFRTVKILKTFGFDKVIDVGANTGQFAESLIDFGFDGEIISIEPTSNAYNRLTRRASKHKNWKIGERCAIGNYNGHTEINVSRNTLFSSIKDIRSDYSEYNSDSLVVNKERVKICTLDSKKKEYFNKPEKIFLKIDTQGFEKEVMEGAKEVLELIKGIKIEIPLQPIYQGVAWDISVILEFLTKRGFTCVSLNEVAVNNQTGIVHEIDGIFIDQELLTECN